MVGLGLHRESRSIEVLDGEKDIGVKMGDDSASLSLFEVCATIQAQLSKAVEALYYLNSRLRSDECQENVPAGTVERRKYLRTLVLQYDEMIQSWLLLRFIKQYPINRDIRSIVVEDSNLRGILEDLERGGYYSNTELLYSSK
jgi:hypothetical protein